MNNFINCPTIIDATIECIWLNGKGTKRRRLLVNRSTLTTHLRDNYDKNHPVNIYRTRQGGNIDAVFKVGKKGVGVVITEDTNIVLESIPNLQKAYEKGLISSDGLNTAKKVHDAAGFD